MKSCFVCMHQAPLFTPLHNFNFQKKRRTDLQNLKIQQIYKENTKRKVRKEIPQGNLQKKFNREITTRLTKKTPYIKICKGNAMMPLDF